MKKQTKKKITEAPKKYFDKKGTFCVYDVYEKSKKTVYYVRGSQAKQLPQITLDGFTDLPSGLYLYKEGFGFGKKGTFLLSAIRKHIIKSDKVFELIVSKNKKKGIKNTSVGTCVTLPYDDVKQLLVRLGGINEQNNDELREEVGSFLSTKFPKKINLSSKNFDEYKAGEVYSMLSKKKVAQKLNEDDLDALNQLFPKIFEATTTKKKIANQKDKLIEKSKRITDKIHLDSVIKQFEIYLRKKTLDEKVWQKFLAEKVLKYQANYVAVIEKENISVNVSYPDFVVVDVYGFIDVFEIKKHDVELLSFDESHENYYWKSDVAKAISQIENYIDDITQNADAYIKKIRRKKSIDLKIVRPRGYIIAGTSKQFKKEKELEDFQKLSRSLKNIDFILYDQLLANLKNLRSKL